ncbi:MAG: hypothetical protein EXR71_10590 [Myxococcales bacterium]|nr:hypothetical protein [Myxococcales bacterium]
MVLLLSLCLAAPVDALSDNSVAYALGGDCPGAESGLRRRVEASPDDIPARLALAFCRFGGTEAGTARADLQSLYLVGAPFDPGTLAKRRNADPAALARLREQGQAALGLLVSTMAARRSFSEAREALDILEPMVGESAPTVAARIGLERTQNGPKLAWPLVSAAVARFPEDANVLEEAGRLTFDDAPNAPSALVDAVLIRGRPTAKLNALLGFLRSGNAVACLTYGARAGVATADRPAWDALRYRCAAAAGDLVAADALATTARLPLDALAAAQHARLLSAAGRDDEAIGLATPHAAGNALAAEVLFGIYARQGRSSDLEALAASLPVASTGRLSAATALVNTRQFASALLLVEGSCGAYVDAEATLCGRVVAAARRGLGR